MTRVELRSRSESVLAAEHISKTFAGNRALDDIDLRVGPGTVHALLGGNGSGKSTLVKILAGVYRADHGGTIRVFDTSVSTERFTPSTAHELGLRFVHQSSAVIPDLSVGENLFLGSDYPRTFTRGIAWREVWRRSQQLLDRFEIDVNPKTPASRLRPATRTMVTIARALHDADTDSILVVDEATAALPQDEVNLLLGTIRRMAASGQSILYISHRLDEVMAVADAATVLRDGRQVADVKISDTSERELGTLVAGKSVADVEHLAGGIRPDLPPVLKVKNLIAGPLRGLDVELHPGEILGVAGLLGSGRSSLLRTIFGAQPSSADSFSIDGSPGRPKTVRAAVQAGVAMIPENRADDAAFDDLSVRFNATSASIRDLSPRGWTRKKRERRAAAEVISQFDVRCASDRQTIGQLSGGNQQKVIVGRWLRREPRLILLDEPTQGVDIGARAEIHAAIHRAVEEGAAAIVVSSDFAELALLCNRVLVIRSGVAVADLLRGQFDAERLSQLAYGVRDVGGDSE